MSEIPTTGHVFRALEDTERFVSEGPAVKRIFFGANEHSVPGPEAYLVERGVGVGADTHFHKVDQFQVIYGGNGAYYQRHPMPRLFLHYADAYSVYGPFGPGPNAAIQNLNLRAVPAPFHGSMPKARDQLVYRGRRHYQFDLDSFTAACAPARGEYTFETLIPAEEDGLSAYLLRVGADTEVKPVAGELRTGRYTYIASGEVRVGERTYPSRSLGWSAGNGPEITLRGGSEGAQLLILHYPYPDTPSVRLAELGRK